MLFFAHFICDKNVYFSETFNYHFQFGKSLKSVLFRIMLFSPANKYNYIFLHRMHLLTKLGFSPRSNDTYEVERIIILGCAIFILVKKLEQTFHGSKMNTVAKNFKCCSSLHTFSYGTTIKNFYCSGASKVF